MKCGMPGAPNQTVLNAVCVCDKGSSPTTLLTTIAPTIAVEKKQIATITDLTFAGTFGRCGILNAPCDYSPAGPWTAMVPTLTLSGQPTLVQGAVLSCTEGGIITIIDPAQGTVGIAL